MNKKMLKQSGWVLLLALVIVFMPSILGNDYSLRIANISMVYMIVVMGLNFIAGLVGQMNLGSAGMYAAGAYTAALLTTKLGVSMWIGLLGAIVMGLLIGLCLGYPTLRLSGIYLTLTTMAFGEIIRMFLNNTSFAGGAIGVRNIPPFSIFGFAFNTQRRQFYLLVGFVIVLTLIGLRIVHSKWGRGLRAIKYSPLAVQTSGINVPNMKMKAFTLSAIYIGIAGVLNVSMVGYTFPGEYTGEISVRFFMMMLVGGVGSVPGCILGAIVVTVLPELLRFMGDYYLLVFYIIVFFMALLTPYGLISIVKRCWEGIKSLVLKRRSASNGNA